MLDFDLAEMYGVKTKRLNEQVKRNIERFPEDFMFQLTKGEWEIMKSQIVMTSSNLIYQNGISSDDNDALRSQIVTSKLPENQTEIVLRSQIATSKQEERRGGTQYLPYAFTEQGVAMLSSVLRSPLAIQVNIGIMRGFVEMRRMAATLSLPDTQADVARLRKDFEELKQDIEDILRDQNDINESTRMQLDSISLALAELQPKEPRKPRRRIGFVQEEEKKEGE